MMASMSSGSYKDDCRPWKIEFHARWSEAQGAADARARGLLAPGAGPWSRVTPSTAAQDHRRDGWCASLAGTPRTWYHQRRPCMADFSLQGGLDDVTYDHTPDVDPG